MSNLKDAYDRVSKTIRDAEFEFRDLYTSNLEVLGGYLVWVDGRIRLAGSTKPLIEEKIEARIKAVPHLKALRAIAEDTARAKIEEIEVLHGMLRT